MNIRYPINIISNDIDKSIKDISDFLGAERVSSIKRGTRLNEVFFIGPYRLVKDLYANQKGLEKTSLRILIDEKFKGESKNSNNTLLANGIYLPADYSDELPFLMLYKRIDALDGKPILISENHLVPGELTIVPETSELLAVLFFNDGKKCTVPRRMKWYSWHSDKSKIQAPALSQKTLKYSIKHDDAFSEDNYAEAEPHELSQPLLSSNTKLKRLINKRRPAAQIYPILSENEAGKILNELKTRGTWIRRSGENNTFYIQEGFDIIAHTQKTNSSVILKDLVRKFYSRKMLRMVSDLSGLELTALHEVYAFRMRSNEFLTKHADSTLNGRLLVRFNWLLQNPEGRDYDLRFWNGKHSSEPVTRFKAISNSATIFYLGHANPHEVVPLPETRDKDRYNIILTFGNK